MNFIMIMQNLNWDTDSLIYKVNTEKNYKDAAEDVEKRLDTRN